MKPIIEKAEEIIRLLFAKVRKGEALDVTELLEFNKLTKEFDQLKKSEDEIVISDPEGLLQHKSMDIYAKEGYKVTVTERTLCFGSSTDSNHAHKYLKVDEIYTVHHTEVHSWQTDVYLKEFPKMSFNSVHFIPAEIESSSLPPQPGRGAEEWLKNRDDYDRIKGAFNISWLSNLLTEFASQSEGKDMYPEK